MPATRVFHGPKESNEQHLYIHLKQQQQTNKHEFFEVTFLCYLIIIHFIYTKHLIL